MLLRQVKVQGHDLDLHFLFNVNEALVIHIVIPLLLSFFFVSLSVSWSLLPQHKYSRDFKNVFKIITTEEMGEQFLTGTIPVD